MRLAPVFAVECGSAWSVLAVAQDGLERREEAEGSLQKAITILRSPAAADLATASGSEGWQCACPVTCSSRGWQTSCLIAVLA